MQDDKKPITNSRDSMLQLLASLRDARGELLALDEIDYANGVPAFTLTVTPYDDKITPEAEELVKEIRTLSEKEGVVQPDNQPGAYRFAISVKQALRLETLQQTDLGKHLQCFVDMAKSAKDSARNDVFFWNHKIENMVDGDLGRVAVRLHSDSIPVASLSQGKKAELSDNRMELVMAFSSREEARGYAEELRGRPDIFSKVEDFEEDNIPVAIAGSQPTKYYADHMPWSTVFLVKTEVSSDYYAPRLTAGLCYKCPLHELGDDASRRTRKTYAAMTEYTSPRTPSAWDIIPFVEEQLNLNIYIAESCQSDLDRDWSASARSIKNTKDRLNAAKAEIDRLTLFENRLNSKNAQVAQQAVNDWVAFVDRKVEQGLGRDLSGVKSEAKMDMEMDMADLDHALSEALRPKPPVTRSIMPRNIEKPVPVLLQSISTKLFHVDHGPSGKKYEHMQGVGCAGKYKNKRNTYPYRLEVEAALAAPKGVGFKAMMERMEFLRQTSRCGLGQPSLDEVRVDSEGRLTFTIDVDPQEGISPEEAVEKAMKNIRTLCESANMSFHGFQIPGRSMDPKIKDDYTSVADRLPPPIIMMNQYSDGRDALDLVGNLLPRAGSDIRGELDFPEVREAVGKFKESLPGHHSPCQYALTILSAIYDLSSKFYKHLNDPQIKSAGLDEELRGAYDLLQTLRTAAASGSGLTTQNFAELVSALSPGGVYSRALAALGESGDKQDPSPIAWAAANGVLGKNQVHHLISAVAYAGALAKDTIPIKLDSKPDTLDELDETLKAASETFKGVFLSEDGAGNTAISTLLRVSPGDYMSEIRAFHTKSLRPHQLDCLSNAVQTSMLQRITMLDDSNREFASDVSLGDYLSKKPEYPASLGRRHNVRAHRPGAYGRHGGRVGQRTSVASPSSPRRGGNHGHSRETYSPGPSGSRANVRSRGADRSNTHSRSRATAHVRGGAGAHNNRLVKYTPLPPVPGGVMVARDPSRGYTSNPQHGPRYGMQHNGGHSNRHGMPAQVNVRRHPSASPADDLARRARRVLPSIPPGRLQQDSTRLGSPVSSSSRIGDTGGGQLPSPSRTSHTTSRATHGKGNSNSRRSEHQRRFDQQRAQEGKGGGRFNY